MCNVESVLRYILNNVYNHMSLSIAFKYSSLKQHLTKCCVNRRRLYGNNYVFDSIDYPLNYKIGRTIRTNY